MASHGLAVKSSGEQIWHRTPGVKRAPVGGSTLLLGVGVRIPLTEARQTPANRKEMAPGYRPIFTRAIPAPPGTACGVRANLVLPNRTVTCRPASTPTVAPKITSLR